MTPKPLLEMKTMEQITTSNNSPVAQLPQVPVNSSSTDRSKKRKQEHITSTPYRPKTLENNSIITNSLPTLPSTPEDELLIHQRRQSDIRKVFAKKYLRKTQMLSLP